MFKPLWLTPLMLAGLTACTSNFVPAEVGPDGKYLGWHCEGDVNSREHWRCDKKTMKDGIVVTETESTGTSKTQPALKDNGFTIQLGAYASRQVAESVAASLAVEGQVNTVDIMASGQVVTVVILGQYISKEQAQGAAVRLNEISDGKKINYWIRSMRSLLDAVVK